LKLEALVDLIEGRDLHVDPLPFEIRKRGDKVSGDLDFGLGIVLDVGAVRQIHEDLAAVNIYHADLVAGLERLGINHGRLHVHAQDRDRCILGLVLVEAHGADKISVTGDVYDPLLYFLLPDQVDHLAIVAQVLLERKFYYINYSITIIIMIAMSIWSTSPMITL
jgi:hypothetical protein